MIPCRIHLTRAFVDTNVSGFFDICFNDYYNSNSWTIDVEWVNKDKKYVILYYDRNDNPIVFRKTKNMKKYGKASENLQEQEKICTFALSILLEHHIL